MNRLKIKNAFTLVELIVVVTILAILSTIGFVSYSGYLTGVRDTNRISSLTAISDGLELYRTKNDLPLPDDSVEVKVDGVTVARQGYAGKNVLQTIEYSKAGKDPKDDSYYSYYLTDDNKYYQLMAFLEESDQLETNTLSQANAATNYSNRHPKVYGKRLGILTDTNNTPIQEVTQINGSGEIDISSSLSSEYIVRIDDVTIFRGSGTLVNEVADILTPEKQNPGSCKDLLGPKNYGKNGFYSITINGNIKKVYCDMLNYGGGWMLITDEMIEEFNTSNTQVLKKSDSNGGLIYEFSSDGTLGGCGNSGPLDVNQEMKLPEDILWDQLRYTQYFYAGASCWHIFGKQANGMYQFETNIYQFDKNVDKIYNQVNMSTSSIDEFDGNTRRCDNNNDNFWHNINGNTVDDVRSAEVILRRGNINNPSYLSTQMSCISGVTKSIYKGIYIK